MLRPRFRTFAVIAATSVMIWTAPHAFGAGAEGTVESAPVYDVALEHGSAPEALFERSGIRSVPSGPPSSLASGPGASFGLVQDETERIEYQDFEGDEFPPEEWLTWDNDNRTGGDGETYTWGMQDCDIPTDSLGVKSAWSVGGGRLGDALLCAGNYDQPSRSWLLRTEIDASDYPGGIQVNLRFKVDIPSDESFQICGSTESPTTIACSNAVGPTPGRWLSFRDPIVFDRAAGLSDAVLIFRYVDETPDGGNIGVYIDDVVIEGITGEAAPTVTPTPDDGPTPEATSSRPVPTTGSLGPTIFLPFAIKNHDVQTNPIIPPTASPGRLEVEFAEDFLDDGSAVNPGPRIGHGILQLCAKESWFDMTVGGEFRREWSEWVGDKFLPLGGDDLNNLLAVPATNGFAEQCVYWEEGGTTVEVPANRYRVQLFHGDATSPAASGEAEVVAAAPGTAEPTAAPTSEPTAEPEPGDCFDPVENGDFEAGPGEGWIERTVAEGGLIRDERTFDGSSYSALFGTVMGVQEQLQGQRPIPNRDADAIEAATLSFVMLMITEETVGGDPDDVFAVCVRGDAIETVECIANTNEDVWPRGRWVSVEQDATEFFTARDGFSVSSLLLVAETNETLGTNFAVDNVELEICLTSGETVIIPIDVGMQHGLEQSVGGEIDPTSLPVDSHAIRLALDASLPMIQTAAGLKSRSADLRSPADSYRWLGDIRSAVR